ncbi:dephospho-CoA kinase [Deinococcus psychrotolerans]|uniref:Dephospho-CoA kinase n=1 Tax=Deinococcus psychrotolerans TaxID=2489213 RepID=A0A3G8YJK8_9DEIO|nr:dephospho-CoA kinase [Deinococcus psychrotolerans]AZI41631.1 dephospho-CoA kinase [Deinococcus psychrotolerans]
MSPSPRRIGLTGSIGAGKSTLARLLRQRGFTVLDADEQARLVTREPETLREIEAAFAGVVVDAELDRPALSARVFGHPEELAKLNAIVHPRVRARMAALEQAAAAAGAGTIFQDVPLLFEGGSQHLFDVVLLVDAPLEVRLERVLARDNLSREAALARDAAQMPAAQKRELADAVLDNGGDEAALAAQLDEVLARLALRP